MKSSVHICTACGTLNSRTSIQCWACGAPLVASSGAGGVSAGSPALSPSPGRLLKERYLVLSVVGKGGMGTVYKGRDIQLGNRLVAIKEMTQTGLSPRERADVASNFHREALLLAALQHPNLPSIYDHFEENDRWYLVMSFIEGQTLVEYLKDKNGRLGEAEVLEIGIGLCTILTYLHTQQPPIIFRDLKPDNVMRTADGHLYLIDFGIARFFRTGQMKDTSIYGSVGYTPPEQFGRAQTTPRSDIYGLGATLYHLLSGYNLAMSPFRLPPLHSFVPTASPALIDLITQMLDLDEYKRPPSAAVVKRTLQTIASNRQLPLPSPFIKPVKKKDGNVIRWAIGGVILLLIALALLAVNLFKGTNDNPSRAVMVFCDAMNTSSPDFQTAYDQFSRQYQREHALIEFQQTFRRTIQCVVASQPNARNEAEISLTQSCPPPPPALRAFLPPPPPGGPPSSKNPVNLTLTHDGGNGWKIASLVLVGPVCEPPPDRLRSRP